MSRVAVVLVSWQYNDFLRCTLPYNVKFCGSPSSRTIFVVTDPADTECQMLCNSYTDHGVQCVISKRMREGGAFCNKGRGLNDALVLLPDQYDWVLFTDADILLPAAITDKVVQNYLIDPHVLHGCMRCFCPTFRDFELYRNYNIHGVPRLYSISENRRFLSVVPPKGYAKTPVYGYFQLWNRKMYPERNYVENVPHVRDSDLKFMNLWKPEDRRIITPSNIFSCVHLGPHGSGNKDRRITPPFIDEPA